MTREVFVDSSAWIALADETDQYHDAAAEAYPDLLRRYQRLVTTNLVVAETYITLRRGLGSQGALAFLESVDGSIRIEKVYSTPQLEKAGAALLRQYEDHDFSLADAVSFALMAEREIRQAFAFDHHFITAGFSLVP